MGWTEQQTLDTTIPAIEAAYAGRQQMISDTLEAIFGKPEPIVPVPEVTPDAIRNVFRLAAASGGVVGGT